MADPKTGPRKAPLYGRKSQKVRSNVSLTESLNAAAEYLGHQAFGSKTTYLEHLIMKDLERNGLTIAEVVKLSDEYRATRQSAKQRKQRKQD